ncbi:MAG: hypothetical protein ACOVOF_10935 [Chryseotalea sp.]
MRCHFCCLAWRGAYRYRCIVVVPKFSTYTASAF